MIYESVQCDSCKKLFTRDSEEFFTIKGNVYIGLYGGVIGDNFDAYDKIVKQEHFCKQCTKRILFGETDEKNVEVDFL